MNPKLSGEIIGEFVPIEEDPGRGVGAKGKGMSHDKAVAVVKEMRASHRPPGRWHCVETYVENALRRIMCPTAPEFELVMHFGLVMFRSGEMMANEKKRRGRPKNRYRNVRMWFAISFLLSEGVTLDAACKAVGEAYGIGEDAVMKVWRSWAFRPKAHGRSRALRCHAPAGRSG